MEKNNQMFRHDAKEIMEQFQVGRDGLSTAQVEQQRCTYGDNVLAEEQKKSVIQVFLEQFKDLLVIILMITAVISAVTGNAESTLVILAVIVLNAVLGTWQHFKAEKSLESLKAMSAPNAKVMRNGVKVEVPASDIVPGDILLLEAGDLVAADGRIIDNFSLQVNESSLTGESEGVNKIAEVIDAENVALGDQKNMVFSGSLVTYGRANVVVTSTGMNTEIGKIAALMNQTQQKKTPLQQSMDQFSKKLAIVIIVICIAVFGLSMYRQMPMVDALMFAVALAVAAIPEALSSIVTIVQAMGTQKMAKENAIIKEINAVESLGSVSVICSDKTGTLTQNKMTTKQVYTDFELFDGEDLNFANDAHRWLLKTAVLANDSTSVDGKEIGDPTEVALINLGHKFWLEESIYRQQHLRLAELAFDSDRKLMSTLHQLDGVYTLCTKGAMDVLLDRSVNIITKDGVRTITETDKETIANVNQQLSENGLRVLAFAYKQYEGDSCPDITLADENGYTFVGLVSMIDPPREESKQAVADAKRGGIRTIMITGDHKVTATAIAKQIGIFSEGDMALSGVELDSMSDEKLAEILEKVSVYARVSPEHKIRIVTAWQNKGKIVSMTGDGVNDAPALKKADIGVAMGITGTEVSKDAASMILTDDNFATIVKAVTNGRNIFNNIKNSIRFLLSGNMSGILSVLYTSLMALPVPFQAVHLLFINLLTDSLPAIAIGMEPARENLLDHKPRDPKKSIMDKEFMLNVLLQGALIAIFVMTAYHIGLNQGGNLLASTMAFATLALARLFHGFNCRGENSIFKLGFRSNMASVGAFVIGVLLLNAVLLIPAFHGLFMIADLTLANLGCIYLLAFMPTLLIQLYKLIREKK